MFNPLDPLRRIALIFPNHVLKTDLGGNLVFVVRDDFDEGNRAGGGDREDLFVRQTGLSVEGRAGGGKGWQTAVAGDGGGGRGHAVLGPRGRE